MPPGQKRAPNKRERPTIRPKTGKEHLGVLRVIMVDDLISDLGTMKKYVNTMFTHHDLS